MEKYDENTHNGMQNGYTKEMDIANRLTDALLDALKDEKQFKRYLVKGKENTDEVILEKVDIDSLNNAIKALKSLEEIKRVMNDAIAGETDSGEENETGVVILPDIKEENNENQ